jgi:hypothetical protein
LKYIEQSLLLIIYDYFGFLNNILSKPNLTLGQQFSTWGTPTPGGMQSGQKGYAGISKSVNKVKKKHKK